MSDQDRVWFEKQLDTKLASLEIQIDIKIDTKLSSLEGRIDTRLVTLGDRIGTKLKSLKDELVEQMRDIETTSIEEFHKWARLSDIRVRGHDSIIRALGAQFEALEGRVEKLESKTH